MIKNFKNYSEAELNAYYVTEIEMMSELERDEAIADDIGTGISSEADLSIAFDEYLDETDFFSEYSEDDEAAINETFNCWADGLCREGQISRNMLNAYCCVGKYK